MWNFCTEMGGRLCTREEICRDERGAPSLREGFGPPHELGWAHPVYEEDRHAVTWQGSCDGQLHADENCEGKRDMHDGCCGHGWCTRGSATAGDCNNKGHCNKGLFACCHVVHD